jgi:hypothetical protein
LKSGHALEAARYFQQFLKEHAGATEAQRADANRGLNEAHAKLGRIDVLGAPAGSEVFLDDERVGVTPLERSLDVEPGTHTVRIHGAADQSVQVTAAAGQGTAARFGGSAPAAPAAAPPPAAPAPSPEEPPAAPAETAPPSSNEAPPEATSPTPPPAEESTRGHWGVVIAGGAVTVVSAGLAIFMGLEKQSAQDAANTASASIASDIATYNGQHPNSKLNAQGACTIPDSRYQKYAGACSDLNTDNNRVNTDATVANIALGVAVGAAAFTLIYGIFGTKIHKESAKEPAKEQGATSALRPVIVPAFGLRTAGASVGFRF